MAYPQGIVWQRLRDGVYLMPEHESCRATLDRLQANVREGGGTALVLRMEEPTTPNSIALFDRKIDYAVLLSEVAQTRELLRPEICSGSHQTSTQVS